MDGFYVKLTLPSVAAVTDAQSRVASSWSSGFNTKGKGAGTGRGGARRRRFVSAASVMNKLKGKKKPDVSGVKQAILKPKQAKKNTLKLPNKKIAEAGTVRLANMPQNFTRSDKGDKMIRQRMRDLFERDRVAFTSRPSFDVDSRVCRVKHLGCFPCVFFGGEKLDEYGVL